MKTSHFIGLIASGVLFIWMAGVQYNDTDAVFWTTLYAVSASLSFGAAFVPVRAIWPVLWGLAAVAIGVVMVVLEGMPAIGDNEVVRELGGLLVIVAHATFVAIVARSPYDKWVDGRPLA